MQKLLLATLLCSLPLLAEKDLMEEIQKERVEIVNKLASDQSNQIDADARAAFFRNSVQLDTQAYQAVINKAVNECLSQKKVLDQEQNKKGFFVCISDPAKK